MIKYCNGYRIKSIINSAINKINWLFLPGGPGIGSEYLEEFCQKLNILENKFLIDFPLDGSNNQGKLDIYYW